VKLVCAYGLNLTAVVSAELLLSSAGGTIVAVRRVLTLKTLN